MKKTTLLLAMLLVAVRAFAQLPLEGFETWPPANWTIINNGGPSQTWEQTTLGDANEPPYQGSYAAFLNRENVAAGTTTEDWLVTPQFTVPANPQLKFFSKLTLEPDNGNIYQIRITTDANPASTNYQIIQTWTEPQINPSPLTYTAKTVNIPASYIGQQVHIAFVMLSDFGDRWLIDNVNVVSQCADPAILTANNFTETTASLSWTNPSGATSWEIEVVPALATPTYSGVVYSGLLPYTAPGLAQDTDYKYYVRALCTTDNPSQWVGPFYFGTVATGAVCSAAIPVTPLPYTTSNNTSNFGDDFDGVPGSGCGTTGNFLNGDEVVYAYTATFTGVISVNMTGNGANSAMFVYDSCDDIGINCVAGGTGNATTPVNLSSVSVFAGTTYYIVISSSTTQSTAYNLSIQQVICPPPTGLAATNMNASSANLTWNANGATSWQVFVQNTGGGAPAGPGTTTTVNTNYNVTQTTAGLPFTPGASYQYYVRADCGAGDGTFSTWAGPFNFMTTQITASLNYVDGFEGPSLWTISNGTQGTKWYIGTVVNNGGTQALYVSQNNGVANTYPIGGPASTVHAYRDIQLPVDVGQINLSFDWKSGGEGNWDYIRVWWVPTNFVPTPGTLITAANSGGVQLGANFNLNHPNWTTANYIINAAPLAGQVRRLIFEWRNDTSGGTGVGGAIDNVNISRILCSAPTALTVGGIQQSSATISWTAPGGTAPGSYDYYYSTTNPAPVAGTTPTGNVPAATAPLTGLTPLTTYYVWVRSNCGATDGTSFWTGPLQFTTSIGNDDCPGATVLPVNPTNVCAQVVNAVFTGANVSSQPNPCTGVNGGDIWFQFTATNTSHDISLSNFAGTAQAIVLSLYEGNECGSLTHLQCSYTNVINATSLVVGTTYKVRAVLNENPAVFNTSFNVCVSTPPPPANSNQSECIITTINFDFELPEPPGPTIYPHFVSHHTVQGWRTTATDEQMEFWSAPNYENVPAYSGDQFIELNANLVSGVYQDYQTPQTTVFSYSFAHRGRQGTDTCQLLAGPAGGPYLPVITATTGNTAWVFYTGTYTVPAGQTVTRFIFQSVSSVGGASVGNYLDAITFTANNGLLSENPMQLDCIDNVGNISAAGVGVWTAHADNPATTQIANANANNTTISGFTAPGVYLYDWTTQYCTSTLEVTYTVGDIAPPVATTAVSYCEGDTAAVLSAQALTGNTLNWYDAATGGTPLAAAPVPVTTTAGTTIYYVSQSTTEGCESSRTAITVTVNAIPTAPLATTAVSYCPGDTATALTADALTGNTLNWYTAATGGTPAAAAPVPDTATAGTTIYYVSQSSPEGCESVRTAITVTVNPTPTAPVASDVEYCIGGTAAPLTAVAATGNTLNWYDVATGGTPLAAAPVPDTATAGTMLYYVSQSSPEGCESLRTAITVTVSDLPAAPVAPDVQYCAGDTAVPLTAVAATGNTLNWYTALTGGTALAGAPVPDTTTAGSTNYYVSQVTAGGCESARTEVTVTINAAITPVTGFTYPTPVCSQAGTILPVTAAGFTSNGTFSAAGLTINPQTGEIDVTAAGNGTFVVTYEVVASGNCALAGSTSFSVTINSPAVPVTAFDFEDSYCFNTTDATPMPATGFATGGTFTVTGGLNIDANTGTIDLSSATPGTYTVTYAVLPDAANCIAGGAFSDTFTLDTEQTFTLQGDCEGNAYIIRVPADFDPAGATYEWLNADGLTVGTDRELNVSDYIGSTTAADSFPMEFMLVVSIDGCESSATHSVDGISCTIQRGISPGEDGKNNSFDLSGFNVEKLSIFNRYGQEVVTFSNYTNQWGGQDKNGNELPSGTYFYMFENNNGQARTGWIYINRQN